MLFLTPSNQSHISHIPLLLFPIFFIFKRLKEVLGKTSIWSRGRRNKREKNERWRFQILSNTHLLWHWQPSRAALQKRDFSSFFFEIHLLVREILSFKERFKSCINLLWGIVNHYWWGFFLEWNTCKWFCYLGLSRYFFKLQGRKKKLDRKK